MGTIVTIDKPLAHIFANNISSIIIIFIVIDCTHKYVGIHMCMSTGTNFHSESRKYVQESIIILYVHIYLCACTYTQYVCVNERMYTYYICSN